MVLRQFVEGFSLIAAPLTKLLRKGVSFNWTDVQQEGFDKFKTILTEAPVLIQPESGKDFIVYSDASHVDFGCVLMQEGKVVALFDDGSLLAELQVKPMWIEQIKGKQLEDESLGLRFRQIDSGNTVDFGLDSEGVLCVRRRICAPNDMHHGRNKIYQDLHELYWWPGLKRELPSRLLQPVKIPLWEWERETMDFVSGLPLTPTKNDSVWVIVD
ncbi:uncharacterized protein LOC128035483 [Gossypium raimondii]|uniref:uncharacterized protein LOC128035483 n=1 Tax=Gossypium raimondii TaxID=29730 RepID=UPI00227B3D30|nr:uncharacterized protein LOC128035483 [Gossypium raimondii]